MKNRPLGLASTKELYSCIYITASRWKVLGLAAASPAKPQAKEKKLLKKAGNACIIEENTEDISLRPTRST